MKVRDFQKEDLNEFIAMASDFYSGDATLFPAGTDNFTKTFEQSLNKSPLMRGLIIEHDGKIAGYALLAFYWSCEAGGTVVQLEDLYIKSDFRSAGLGSQFMDWLLKEYSDTVARFRLEVCPKNGRVKNFYEKYGFCELPYIQMIKDK